MEVFVMILILLFVLSLLGSEIGRAGIALVAIGFLSVIGVAFSSGLIWLIIVVAMKMGG